MSRIGKKPVFIPESVHLDYKDNVLNVKGPKGELQLKTFAEIKVNFDIGKLTLETKNDQRTTRALHGLLQRLISNAVEGVTNGFTKKLEYKGVGYRAAINGNKIILNIGYSHPVEIIAPKNIEFKVEKNIISVVGIDKQLVGEMAAQIRQVRPPEPYKGKGIRYLGEYVKIKQGKAAKTASAS